MTDRQKLIELLMDKPFGNSTEEREIAHAEDVAEYLISNGVTVRERGRWKKVEVDLGSGIKTYRFACNKCDFLKNTLIGNFCPNCGADMRGEEDA